MVSYNVVALGEEEVARGAGGLEGRGKGGGAGVLLPLIHDVSRLPMTTLGPPFWYHGKPFNFFAAFPLRCTAFGHHDFRF